MNNEFLKDKLQNVNCVKRVEKQFVSADGATKSYYAYVIEVLFNGVIVELPIKIDYTILESLKNFLVWNVE